MTTFTITKHFTTGILRGLTIQEITTVRFEVGREYKSVGSSYIITEVSPQ